MDTSTERSYPTENSWQESLPIWMRNSDTLSGIGFGFVALLLNGAVALEAGYNSLYASPFIWLFVIVGLRYVAFGGTKKAPKNPGDLDLRTTPAEAKRTLADSILAFNITYGALLCIVYWWIL